MCINVCSGRLNELWVLYCQKYQTLTDPFWKISHLKCSLWPPDSWSNVLQVNTGVRWACCWMR